MRPRRSRTRACGRAVYLITGGLSVIGLTFAAYLAAAVSARLVLLSLAPVPPRERWDVWLAHADARDPLANAIRAARDLEALDAEVLVLRADLTDKAQSREAIAQAEARFGALDGVIHAAEQPESGPAHLMTSEAAAAVLAPKLHGTLALERALGERQLDFLVLCSSLGTFLGGAGQITSCAANAFVDAFAQRRALDSRTFTVAINWDAWNTFGAADADAGASPVIPAGGLLPREGFEALARILGMRHPLPQVLVAAGELSSRVAEARALPRPSRRRGLRATTSAVRRRSAPRRSPRQPPRPSACSRSSGAG